ncbi:MAG: hypothetical protein ABJM29_03920 [Rhizobiaceae bacterium]
MSKSHESLHQFLLRHRRKIRVVLIVWAAIYLLQLGLTYLAYDKCRSNELFKGSQWANLDNCQYSLMQNPFGLVVGLFGAGVIMIFELDKEG